MHTAIIMSVGVGAVGATSQALEDTATSANKSEPPKGLRKNGARLSIQLSSTQSDLPEENNGTP